MTISGRISQSAFDGSRLRVILLLDLYDGAQQQFLDAYELMRNQVASVPGHLSDQLCQSIENPSQWLITSEWESAPPFLAWVNSEEHVETVRPMHSCVRDTRSMRYSILRETDPQRPAHPGAGAKAAMQVAARVGDGVVRHALTFTVKPGTESKVAEILADYTSPEAQVDDTTRLRRTSLFMHGNRVVRAVEVEGDLLAALRHVARQPEVRAVEEAINPYLEQDRDLGDPDSARVFFTRAALPAVHHVVSGEQGTRRAAAARAVLPGEGGPRHGPGPAARPPGRGRGGRPAQPGRTAAPSSSAMTSLSDSSTSPASSTPTRCPSLGLRGPGKAAELEGLLDGAAIGVEGSLETDRNLNRLLSHADMMPVTDRSSARS